MKIHNITGHKVFVGEDNNIDAYTYFVKEGEELQSRSTDTHATHKALIFEFTSAGVNCEGGEHINPSDIVQIYGTKDCSLTKISDSAFANCTKLQSVILPSVTSIGVNAFSGCTNLTQMNVSAISTSDVKKKYSTWGLDGNEQLVVQTYDGTYQKPQLYVITFNLQYEGCGYILNDIYVEAGDSIGKENKLAVLDRDGYDFIGWFTVDGEQVDTNYVPTSSITLYAYWKEKAEYYQITFMVDDELGTYTGELVQKVERYQNATPPVIQPIDGYEFIGWDSEEYLNVTSDATITANIIKKKQSAYMVTFNSNGGNYDDISFSGCISVTAGKAIGNLPEPHLLGYKFEGWWNEPQVEDGEPQGGYQIDENYIVQNDLVLFAHWSLIEYKITYTIPEGWWLDEHADTEVKYSYTINDFEDDDYIPPPPQSKSEHGFKGWIPAKIEGGHTGDVEFVADITEYCIITVPTIDESNSMTFEVEKGSKFGSADIKYECAIGYDFSGWFTQKEGGEQITDETVINENITIYAHYTPTVYTITYKLDDGWVNPNTKTTYTIEDETFTPEPATKDGEKFGGWYPSCILKGSTGDVTFDGATDEKRLTITFMVDGNVFLIKREEFDGLVGTLPIPSKQGYEFEGWYAEEDGMGGEITEDYSIQQSMTLYALFVPIVYTITYDMNGVGTNPNKFTTYTVEDWGFVPQNPENVDGYEFTGWNPSKIEDGTYGNIVITANWSKNSGVVPIPYEITYNLNGHGTLPEDVLTSYTIETEYTPPTLSEEGYTFNGWTPTKIEKGNTGDVTFTASWSEVSGSGETKCKITNEMPYDVELTDSDGNTITLGGCTTTEVSKNTEYTIKSCNLSGFKFTDSDTFYLEGATITFTEDKTIEQHLYETTDEELAEIDAKYPVTYNTQEQIDANTNITINYEDNVQNNSYGDNTAFVVQATKTSKTFTIAKLVLIDASDPAIIDWGDGKATTVSEDGSQSHSYARSGTYTIVINNKISGLAICSQTSTEEPTMLKVVLNVGYGITMFGPYCFYNCTNLTFIQLPPNMTHIARGVFTGCSNLKTIYSMPTTAPLIMFQDSFGDSEDCYCGKDVAQSDRRLIVNYGATGYDDDESDAKHWRSIVICNCGYTVKYETIQKYDPCLLNALTYGFDDDDGLLDVPEDWVPKRLVVINDDEDEDEDDEDEDEDDEDESDTTSDK